MDNLAAYADESDDDDESPTMTTTRRQRRSSSLGSAAGANASIGITTATISPIRTANDDHDDDDDIWREDIADRESVESDDEQLVEEERSDSLVGSINRKRRDTEIPEAPGSSHDEGCSSTSIKLSMKADDNEAWISPDTGDEAPSTEPPPPKRNNFAYSPSPSSSTAPSPANRLPNNTSTASLVSYAAAADDDDNRSHNEHDDEADQFRSAVIEVTSNFTLKSSKSKATMKQPSRAQPNHTDINNDERDNIDPHEYLEQTLLNERISIGNLQVEGMDRLQDTYGNSTPPSVPSDSPPPIVNEVALPPRPKEPCDPALTQYFEMMFKRKANGEDLNRKIQDRKDFKNPSMYEKLIEHFEIDEAGTNFSKSIYDPKSFPPDCYYDRLAEAQKVLMDRLEKEKKHGSTANTTSQQSTLAGDAAKSRKSRFV